MYLNTVIVLVVNLKTLFEVAAMGFFRLLFAFTVVLTHTEHIYGYLFGNPVVAVRSFFMISGFYMAMVLTEKYKAYKPFILSRFLRIYPIYWVILILTVLASFLAYFVSGSWGELRTLAANINQINPITFGYLLISHITIYGRGVLSFLTFDSITGFFTAATVQSGGVDAPSFLLVPQAWTVALELLFYLIAPLVVRKSTVFIFLLAAISLVVRYALLCSGFNTVAWNYFFFPSELVFFLMGILAYRGYKMIKFGERCSKTIGLVSSVILAAYLAFYGLLVINGPFSMRIFSVIPEKEILFYFLFWLALPFIFILSRKSTFDRTIGDLSYPVYISHILIWTLFYPKVFSALNIDKSYAGIIAFGLTVCFSVLLNRFVQKPIDQYRRKFSATSKKIVN